MKSMRMSADFAKLLNWQVRSNEKMNIYNELKEIRKSIPVNTYKTILGQVRSGDIKGAEKGIQRIKERSDKHGRR